MHNTFAEKRVFIAGGTGGIGKAIAQAFLDNGAKVFIHGRNEKKLDGIPGIALDLDDQENIEKAAKAAKEFLGEVDIFVSAIGSGKYKNTGLLSKDEWEEVLQKNFFSSVLLVNAVTPYMGKSDPNIIVIGSIAGKERLNAPVGYTVAKAALNTFVRSVSPELAEKNIRINIVNPGNIYFEGGRWDELKKEDEKKVTEFIDQNVPQKRFGKPEDVARAVLFFASPKSDFVTGSSLEIDGGQHVSF